MVKLTDKLKLGVAAAANKYITDKGLSASDLGRDADINDSYLSYILRGTFVIKGTGKETVIPDKYFINIARYIGHPIEKSYWPHVVTREFQELIVPIKESKEKCLVKTLILKTGSGKTYVVEQFKRAYPLHTYVITMHNLLKINDMFDELNKQLGLSNKGSRGVKRSQIVMALRDIQRNGGKPIVLIDEGENMDQAMRGVIKGFYDAIHEYVGIVLLGTEKLMQLLERARDSDDQSGPQLYRRLKAGITKMTIVQTKMQRYQPFFEALNINDPAFRQLICDTCDNYGELHDFVAPALKAADERQEEFNEDFFRIMYNIPKAKKRA